jgi:hypothetical protein
LFFLTSGKKVKVTFELPANGATSVAVVGDFNGWDTRRHPMRLREGGVWEIFLPGLEEATLAELKAMMAGIPYGALMMETRQQEIAQVEAELRANGEMRVFPRHVVAGQAQLAEVGQARATSVRFVTAGFQSNWRFSRFVRLSSGAMSSPSITRSTGTLVPASFRHVLNRSIVQASSWLTTPTITVLLLPAYTLAG